MTTPIFGIDAASMQARVDWGSADTQTLRSDLLHERGRTDKLTSAVISIATATREPAP